MPLILFMMIGMPRSLSMGLIYLLRKEGGYEECKSTVAKESRLRFCIQRGNEEYEIDCAIYPKERMCTSI